MPSGRTSRPELQAPDLLATLPACSGRRQNHPYRRHHECKLGDHTKDDADKEPHPVGVLKRRCTMGPARIYPSRKMHRSRAPSIAPGTFFVARPWADCITNMPGFNLRQAQALIYKRTGNLRAVQLCLATVSLRARFVTSTSKLMMRFPSQSNSICELNDWCRVREFAANDTRARAHEWHRR
jgi:hypothetical protein